MDMNNGLVSREALKAYARKVICGDNPTNSLLIRMFDEIIDNAPEVEPERSQGEGQLDMTDQEKVIKLLKELGIEFEVNGNTIYIDRFYCDGAEDFGVSFWNGEDAPKGKFHEFWVVPWQPIPEVSFKDAMGLFDEWVAYAEGCLKEHNWRFLGFPTWLGAIKNLSGSQIEEVIKLTSHA